MKKDYQPNCSLAQQPCAAKDINDYTIRRMEAEKDFASMGMTLETFERPISESEIPTRLD